MKIKKTLKFFSLCFAVASLSALVEQPPQTVIRLGATIPLTGDYASYGKIIRDGIELAKADLRSAGYSLTVFYEDVPMPGPSAVTAIRTLTTRHQIHGLAANFLNPAMPPMAPIIMQKRIPSFHTAAVDDSILTAGDYIFSTNSRIRDEARKVAEHAVNVLHAKTAAVLFVATTFGDNYASHFRKRFEELGGKVVEYETTAIDSVDHRALIARAKRQQPDVYFAAYFGTNFGVVLNQIKQQGIIAPILGVYETEDNSVLRTAGLNADGVSFFVPEPNRTSWVREQFLKRFEKRFGYAPPILASNSYDATVILTRALQNCRLDPECTKNHISQTKNFPGVSGTFSIGADGAASKEFILKTIKNNQFLRKRTPRAVNRHLHDSSNY